MRRTIFILIVCLLLGAGLFRVVQLLNGPRTAVKSSAEGTVRFYVWPQVAVDVSGESARRAGAR